MTRRSVLVSVVLVLAAVACSKKEGGGGGGGELSKYPGTEEGAKKLLTDIRSGDAAAMTKALKPTSDDYKAVFVEGAAAKAESAYEKFLDQFETSEGQSIKPGKEAKVDAVTDEELQQETIVKQKRG